MLKLVVLLVVAVVAVHCKKYPYQKSTADCWGHCGAKGGICTKYCGPNGFCCRNKWNDKGCTKTMQALSPKYHTCVIAAPSLTSLGCWQDKASRAIPTLEGKDKGLDGQYWKRKDVINKCMRAALAKGYNVFAVQHGGWCASSATALATYKKYGPSKACKNGKGGPWANTVYLIGGSSVTKRVTYTKVYKTVKVVRKGDEPKEEVEQDEAPVQEEDVPEEEVEQEEDVPEDENEDEEAEEAEDEALAKENEDEDESSEE